MSGHSTAVVVVAIVAVLLVAGGLLARCDGSASKATTASRADAHDVVNAKCAWAGDSKRDEAGAVAAAMAYVSAAQDWLYLDDDQIRDEITEAASPRAARALASDVIDRISKARDALAPSSGRIWWLVRPLATRVVSCDDRQVRVEVWTATVLSAAEVAAPQTEWTTLDLDLAWMRGAWLVDAVRESAGPTPVPGPGDEPWDAVAFDQALDGFTRVDGEPLP